MPEDDIDELRAALDRYRANYESVGVLRHDLEEARNRLVALDEENRANAVLRAKWKPIVERVQRVRWWKPWTWVVRAPGT